MSSIDMVDDDEAKSDKLGGYRDVAREDDTSVSDEVNRKSVLLLLKATTRVSKR